MLDFRLNQSFVFVVVHFSVQEIFVTRLEVLLLMGLL